MLSSKSVEKEKFTRQISLISYMERSDFCMVQSDFDYGAKWLFVGAKWPDTFKTLTGCRSFTLRAEPLLFLFALILNRKKRFCLQGAGHLDTEVKRYIM